MEREYEPFELLADGSPMWRSQASGLRDVRLKLQEISKTTANECFAMYLPTKEIVARLNVGASRGADRKPLVFQIHYDDRLATARANILRLHGYEVVSVAGTKPQRNLELASAVRHFHRGTCRAGRNQKRNGCLAEG